MCFLIFLSDRFASIHINNCHCLCPVSYTHLDVYKRQQLNYAWNNRLLAGLITKKGSTSTQPTTATSNTSTTSTTLGSKTKITASASNYSIRIKKPSGLSASAVSCTDDYSNKRLRIIVNGNYKTFFSSASNRYIKESLTYNVSYSGGKTYIDLKTNVIKGFSVIQTSSYIYVKYADPKKMFYHVVVVDACLLYTSFIKQILPLSYHS